MDKPTEQQTDVSEVRDVENLPPELKELVELTNKIVDDAQKAIAEHNKSAARRARGSIMDLKKKCTPLRQLILEKISGDNSEES